MKIGIIGTGNMGRTLGLRWAEAGHEVLFGSSELAKAQAVAAMAHDHARAGTYDEAASFGEIIFYSLRDRVPSQVLRPQTTLDGTIIIDPNNRAIPNDFAYGPLMDESIAERIQADVPHARVVKAFNTMPQEVYELSATALRTANTALFLAGDDADARQQVAALAEAMGLHAIDCGGLRNARMLEALADFTRYLIGGKQLGPFTTLAVNVLPSPQQSRFGSRQPSALA